MVNPNRAERPKAISIFRYPGGKSKLLKRIVPLIWLTDSPHHTYIEPFVGGGSVALAVAQKWPSIRLILNDLDANIYSFWKMVACGDDQDVEQLLALIRERPTVGQFRSLRATKPATCLDKAFHSLFFNRTTFGGMANSGPLGGYAQGGTGKIDSRWNPSKLATDIKTARRLLRGRTVVLNKDFEPVIAQADDRSFMYFDPPYYKAGNELYTSRWKDDDHVRLSEALRGRDNWLLSYDAHPRIQEIYPMLVFPVPATYSIAKNKCRELLLAQLPIHEFPLLTLDEMRGTQMGTMVETIENAIIPEPEAETQPDSTEPDDGIIETELTQEISTLWSDHVRLSASRRATAKELCVIRARLAERLHAMKSLLSRPGRLGQWRGWLKQQGIPRSTADRLVSRHAETLGIENGNVPTGAIWEPAKDGAGMKLAKVVWPQILKYLTKDESVVEFISGIVTASGINHQRRAKGLMIFNPVCKAADGLPCSASATDPAPQPSDEAGANTGEPAAETTMATAATEALAGVADNYAEVAA